MYYLLGFEQNLSTIAVLSKIFLKCNAKKASFADLKQAYFAFTKYIQPDIPDNYSLHEINFVEEYTILEQLLNFFVDINCEENKTISGAHFNLLDDKCTSAKKFALIKCALNFLQENNKEHCFIIQILFSYIFLIESGTVACATVPKALGILLFDHKDWSISDICEMLIHEAAHQLITLDEYRYGHYLNLSEINKPENYVRSAIRKTNRPINKVIHSLIVAYEIIMYRENFSALCLKAFIHPETEILKQQIIDSINSLKKVVDNKNILTSRAKELCSVIENEIHSRM